MKIVGCSSSRCSKFPGGLLAAVRFQPEAILILNLLGWTLWNTAEIPVQGRVSCPNWLGALSADLGQALRYGLSSRGHLLSPFWDNSSSRAPKGDWSHLSSLPFAQSHFLPPLPQEVILGHSLTNILRLKPSQSLLARKPDVQYYLSLKSITALSPSGSVVKNPPAKAGDTGLIPGSGNPLEREMATYSSILAWQIPWTEEPGGLQSMGSQRVGHDWAHWASKMLILS